MIVPLVALISLPHFQPGRLLNNILLVVSISYSQNEGNCLIIPPEKKRDSRSALAPYVSIDYVSAPNSAGDRLLVGNWAAVLHLNF